MQLHIENQFGMIKDTSSKAVLNNDINSLDAYKARRKVQRESTEEIRKLKGEIQNLQSEMGKIKRALGVE